MFPDSIDQRLHFITFFRFTYDVQNKIIQWHFEVRKCFSSSNYGHEEIGRYKSSVRSYEFFEIQLIMSSFRILDKLIIHKSMGKLSSREKTSSSVEKCPWIFCASNITRYLVDHANIEDFSSQTESNYQESKHRKTLYYVRTSWL